MPDQELKCGFRYDPIGWAENDTSLQGAQVRAVVLGRPKPEDTAILNSAGPHRARSAASPGTGNTCGFSTTRTSASA